MDILYVVMPAYNEEANLESTIRSWYPIVERHPGGGNSRLVVLNDGSSDNTGAIGQKLMAELPLFQMIDKPNSGHGPTVIYAYRYALEQGADYVFQTDSDGQTSPDEFENFWTLRTQYDGIFGNRTVRGDGKSRAYVEKVVCLLLRLYFGVKVPDANAPFRLMNAKTLEKHLYKLPPDYNLPNIMLTAFFVSSGEKTRFEEISFRPRTAGTNSINLKKIFKIGWKALGDFRKFKREMAKDASN